MCSARRHAPVGDAHKYVLEVTRSAAQASEVVRAAWSKYKGKDNPDLRLLDLDKVAALIEADFPTQAVLRAAAQQPVRHAREPGGAARSAAASTARTPSPASSRR